MTRLPSALAITLRPAAAWDALRDADPSWPAALLRHALPLSLLPASAWPVGQALAGRLDWSLQAFAASFVSTLFFYVASVLLLAAGFYVLGPFFEAARAWRRAVALAAFASTPVFLAGALLVMPALIAASVVAFVHCCALCYLGAQRLLGCPEADAAFFVAGAFVFMLMTSLVLGALCSAAGLI